jgi:hypothetical protein
MGMGIVDNGAEVGGGELALVTLAPRAHQRRRRFRLVRIAGRQRRPIRPSVRPGVCRVGGYVEADAFFGVGWASVA